jgi:hypothetical protein
MPPGRRVKSCVGKVAYSTYENARAEARYFMRQGKFQREDSHLEPYRCPYCSGWHLGHAPERVPRFERKRNRNWRNEED